jgi:hemerythrin-like domain-containing protein
MLPFHNGFRAKHAALMQRLPEASQMSKSQLMSFLQIGASLAQHLEAHHGIEEAYIFPLLAKKLPQFGKEHLQEHATMHQAVEGMGKYIEQCAKKLQNGRAKKGDDDVWPKDIFDEEKMRSHLDHLRDTLFVHLEHEEASLRPESLKKAGFTEDDIRRIPM